MATYITNLLVLGQVDKHGDEVGLEILHLHHLREVTQLPARSSGDKQVLIIVTNIVITHCFYLTFLLLLFKRRGHGCFYGIFFKKAYIF